MAVKVLIFLEGVVQVTPLVEVIMLPARSAAVYLDTAGSYMIDDGELRETSVRVHDADVGLVVVAIRELYPA